MDKLRTRVGDLAARMAAWMARLLTTVRTTWASAFAARSSDEGGQGLAEYALILAFIAIVAIAALAFFGLQLSSVLTDPVGKDIGDVVNNLP